jgi:hypothetical protein
MTKIVFFTTAKTEIDNFLPIFDLISKKNTDLKIDIVVLNYAWRYLDTPFFASKVPERQRKVIYELIGQPLVRFLLTKSSVLLNIAIGARARAGNKFFYIKIITVLQRFIDQTLRMLRSGACNLELEKYDYWFCTTGILGKIKNNNIPSFSNLITWRSDLEKKIVCYPETIDQWREVVEFHDYDENLGSSDISGFLSRGDKSKRVVLPDDTQIFDIGSPRYSEAWCAEMNSFYGTSNHLRTEDFLEVLYLPTKCSPRKEWLQLLINKMDEDIYRLISQYPFVRVTISPSPRSSGEYDNASQRVSDPSRLVVRETDVDTCELAMRADICMTAGTSFIPHLLWAGKPVVLNSEWTIPLKQSFEYEKLCFDWTEMTGVIESYRARKLSWQLSTESRAWLEKFLQCGNDSDRYQKKLTAELTSLVNCLAQ